MKCQILHIDTAIICRIYLFRVCSQLDYLPKAFNNYSRYFQNIINHNFPLNSEIPEASAYGHISSVKYICYASVGPNLKSLVCGINEYLCNLQITRGHHAPSNDIVLEDLNLPGLSELKGRWHGSLDASGGGNGDTVVYNFSCLYSLEFA